MIRTAAFLCLAPFLAALARAGVASHEDALPEVRGNDAEIVRENDDGARASGIVVLGTSFVASLRETQGDDVDNLIAKFRKAQGARRDEFYSELQELVYPAEMLILLSERIEAAGVVLSKGKTLSRLEAVKEERTELDRLRVQALGIIDNEVKYFTPYRVPEVSSERAAEYRKVQAEIDELVDQIREVWEGSKDRKLPKAFAAALEDFGWSHAASLKLDPSSALPATFPAWLAGLDTERAAISVRTFGWTAKDLESIRRSALVMEANERRGAAQKKVTGVPEARVPSAAEIKQVQITNEYRVLMGRPALAWNPRLQEAAQGHSDYMSKTGIFSHFEDDVPKRRTVGQRCQLAGYNQGRGENIAAGTATAQDSHRAWCHSAGHHRNLLHGGHTEVATALAGRFWTQNFGSRPTPDEELKPATSRR